ncbi:MAG: DUF1338 domain-containing protein [Bacteroidales bacterium]|nr:DUF1338 domain-containing protein [Bacteroidales bacterium]
MKQYNETFQRFWDTYSSQNPSAKRIHALFTTLGEEVVHDHIALRTFNDPRMNIDVVAKVFTDNGYEARGTYDFKAKKVFGKHFEHKTDPEAPKVFISELLLEQFSDFLRQTVNEKLDSLPDEAYRDPMLVFGGSIWGEISLDTYNKLREESEYAAWTLVYGYRANHFAIKVNALKNFGSLQDVNAFIKDNGYLMNTSSGNEIYGAPEELLEQSATRAEIREVRFTDGMHKIPSCFYEFTLRYPDADGLLYPGFKAANADKIFESTNFYRAGEAM